MGNRQASYWCLGLTIVGFSAYIGAVALFESSLLILIGLVMGVAAMSAWAVAGLNDTRSIRHAPFDVSSGIDFSRTHLADPALVKS